MIGNTLNSSTFRGGAQGFQLDALLKVDVIDFGVERSSYSYAVERNEDSQRWPRLSDLATLPGSSSHAIESVANPIP